MTNRHGGIMKIESQHPKLPVQDKNSPKGKETERIKGDHSSSTRVRKKEADQFAVNKMRARMEEEPDVNLKKVKELRAKIKKGEYQVDTKKLANKLIKDSILEDT